MNDKKTKSTELIATDVIPAVCATCNNTENGGNRKIVCSFNPISVVGTYSSCRSGCKKVVNIYVTCNKWKLADSISEDLKKWGTLLTIPELHKGECYEKC